MRGLILLEAFAEVDMVLATRYTLRSRDLGCIVDLTYMSDALASIVAWQLSEDNTNSDYQAICSSKKKSSRIASGLSGWMAYAFEGNIFSATPKLDLSLVGAAREKLTQITEFVMEPYCYPQAATGPQKATLIMV